MIGLLGQVWLHGVWCEGLGRLVQVGLGWLLRSWLERLVDNRGEGWVVLKGRVALDSELRLLNKISQGGLQLEHLSRVA